MTMLSLGYQGCNDNDNTRVIMIILGCNDNAYDNGDDNAMILMIISMTMPGF